MKQCLTNSKHRHIGAKRSIFQNTPKCVSSRGSALDPIGELITLLKTPSRLKRGHPSLYPTSIFPPSAVPPNIFLYNCTWATASYHYQLRFKDRSKTGVKVLAENEIWDDENEMKISQYFRTKTEKRIYNLVSATTHNSSLSHNDITICDTLLNDILRSVYCPFSELTYSVLTSIYLASVMHAFKIQVTIFSRKIVFWP